MRSRGTHTHVIRPRASCIQNVVKKRARVRGSDYRLATGPKTSDLSWSGGRTGTRSMCITGESFVDLAFSLDVGGGEVEQPSKALYTKLY